MRQLGLLVVWGLCGVGCERADGAPTLESPPPMVAAQADMADASADASMDEDAAADVADQRSGPDVGADFLGSDDGVAPEGAFGISGQGKGRGGVMRSDPRMLKDPYLYNAPLRVGAVTVQGGLDGHVVQRIARMQRAGLRACYKAGLNQYPGLKGAVTVKVTINAQGRVQRAQVEESELNTPEVERCVAERVSRWSFPAVEGGGVGQARLVFELGG